MQNGKENGIVNIDLLHKEIRRRNYKCSYDLVFEIVKKKNLMNFRLGYHLPRLSASEFNAQQQITP